MTGKQVRSLRRKARMVAVIGASVYLAVGVTKLGHEDKLRLESKVETTFSTPIVTASAISEATPEPTESTERETEHQSLIYSYDWSGKESYLLAKIAMAEAGNQDTEGKALVMLVVLNRVWVDEFPDSIEEVIYQPGQFSPISDGAFDRAEPDDDCWDALDMVMQGWDESKGALYFESKSSSTWHEDNLKFLFKHQDHYFYTDKE